MNAQRAYTMEQKASIKGQAKELTNQRKEWQETMTDQSKPGKSSARAKERCALQTQQRNKHKRAIAKQTSRLAP